MAIDPCNKISFTNQAIPANVCKHTAIISVLSLFTNKPDHSLSSANSKELNRILTCSSTKGVFYKKEAEKALLEGIKHLNANHRDINNNIDKYKITEACFKKVAEYGYPLGHFLIGELYIQNADTKADQEKGIEHLKKAAEENHLYACLSLAEIYTYKAQSELSYKTQAIKYYKKAGKLGSSNAYLKLAEIFQNRAEKSCSRKNATADYEKAIKYYKKAGKLGSSNAYLKLAEIFQNRAEKSCSRKNATADYEKAIKYYKKAGKLGSSNAYLKLAKLYANRNCHDQVINYCEKASKLGCKRSSLTLGRIYLYGLITEKNLDKAINFLSNAGDLRSDLENKICSWKSSGLNLEEKYFNLAELFINSAILETESSLKELYTREAINYYEKAGELGCFEAYLRLSPIYLYGMGVEKNREKTIECLEKAVALGSSTASFRLRAIYTQLAEEHLLNENLQQAVSCYEKAGKHGSMEAYFLLGEMCLCGRIFKDPDAMIQYYKEAADQSHIRACKRLYEIYKYGIAGVIAPHLELAKTYLEKAQNTDSIPFIDE